MIARPSNESGVKSRVFVVITATVPGGPTTNLFTLDWIEFAGTGVAGS